MNLLDALDAHLDHQFATLNPMTLDSHRRITGADMTREYLLTESWSGGATGDYAIAWEVGHRVAEHLGELISYDQFDNCREHGLMFTAPGPDMRPGSGWSFSVYEHRNSDEICVQGCRTAEVKSYGTWPDEDISPHDVLHRADWCGFDSAATALIALLEASTQVGRLDRPILKHIAADAVKNPRTYRPVPVRPGTDWHLEVAR